MQQSVSQIEQDAFIHDVESEVLHCDIDVKKVADKPVAASCDRHLLGPFVSAGARCCPRPVDMTFGNLVAYSAVCCVF